MCLLESLHRGVSIVIPCWLRWVFQQGTEAESEMSKALFHWSFTRQGFLVTSGSACGTGGRWEEEDWKGGVERGRRRGPSGGSVSGQRICQTSIRLTEAQRVRCPEGQEPLSEGRSYLTFVPTHRHTCPTDNWNGIFLPSTHLSGGHLCLLTGAWAFTSYLKVCQPGLAF